MTSSHKKQQINAAQKERLLNRYRAEKSDEGEDRAYMIHTTAAYWGFLWAIVAIIAYEYFFYNQQSRSELLAAFAFSTVVGYYEQYRKTRENWALYGAGLFLIATICLAIDYVF